MGPGGPGGPGGPVGPWGQWLPVSVKVLDRNGSPGKGKRVSEWGWGRGTVTACRLCRLGSGCPMGQPAAQTGSPVPAARYRGREPWLSLCHSLAGDPGLSLADEHQSESSLSPTVYRVSGGYALRIMGAPLAGGGHCGHRHSTNKDTEARSKTKKDETE